ncbi:hypothetical protein BDZ91DRAFT_851056 [Kalaharituber pfeilii]|nr:hypothetical protein BDZ91DRAFT_851056 [Kalaharituber pfeilii]
MDFSEVDLHSLNYLSPVDHNLCCPICRSPLVDPVYTSCLHTFCSSCITRALERSQTCPVDRSILSPDDVSPAPIMIANLVNELAVLCPNSELGCPFTCARYLLEGHLNQDCDFVYVDCRGCDDRVLRRDAGKECLHQLQECPNCFEQVRKMDLEAHDKECPGLQGTCQHCGAEFMRPHIKEHELSCDEATISCTSSSLGCPWTGRRRELSSHQTACPFTFLRPVLQSHAERITKLELENRTLRKKIDLLTPRKPQNEVDESLSFDDQAYQLLTEQEHIRQDMDRLSATLGELEIKQGMLLMNESLRTKEELAGIRAAINGIRMQIHWLLTARVHGGEHRHHMGPAGAGPASSSAQPRAGDDANNGRPSDSVGQGVKL